MISNTGGDVCHPNEQPYLSLHTVIAPTTIVGKNTNLTVISVDGGGTISGNLTLTMASTLQIADVQNGGVTVTGACVIDGTLDISTTDVITAGTTYGVLSCQSISGSFGIVNVDSICGEASGSAVQASTSISVIVGNTPPGCKTAMTSGSTFPIGAVVGAVVGVVVVAILFAIFIIWCRKREESKRAAYFHNAYSNRASGQELKDMQSSQQQLKSLHTSQLKAVQFSGVSESEVDGSLSPTSPSGKSLTSSTCSMVSPHN